MRDALPATIPFDPSVGEAVGAAVVAPLVRSLGVVVTSLPSQSRLPSPLQRVRGGSFPPDRHGIHDLGGNFGEWCEDWWNHEMDPYPT